MAVDIDKTSVYYINKRIDKLEENLQQQIDNRFDSLEKTIDTHLGFCLTTRENFSKRVGKLESNMSIAAGAVALFLVLIGIWQAAKVN